MEQAKRMDGGNVRRLFPCPVSAAEWTLLCRLSLDDGVVEYTAVRVPVSPEHDERYLKTYQRTGWKLAFHAPDDPNRICWTFEGWNPDEPEKMLLEGYRSSSLEGVKDRRVYLSRYRYVAVG